MVIDYEGLARSGMPAEQLAVVFLKDYFKGEIAFPIDPFKILCDLNINFIFRPFKRYEGVYIPSEYNDDIPVVGINSNRPITRQRYTAAHELCHYLKDTNAILM